MPPGALPSIDGPQHPDAPFELLYVGIAPKGAASNATLRSRVRGQHLGGNIGSSTFRQSLAALLIEERGWRTRWSGSRSQLLPKDNRALSEWQRDHLRLAWAECAHPWAVKARVIAVLQPPLNLAGNASHPLYHELKQRRASLRASRGPRETAQTESASRGGARLGRPARIPDPVRPTADVSEGRSQTGTAKDIEVGQVRIPRGATKSMFPRDRETIVVFLHGRELTCRWDPRYGPPERSGVIRVGKQAARECCARVTC